MDQGIVTGIFTVLGTLVGGLSNFLIDEKKRRESRLKTYYDKKIKLYTNILDCLSGPYVKDWIDSPEWEDMEQVLKQIGLLHTEIMMYGSPLLLERIDAVVVFLKEDVKGNEINKSVMKKYSILCFQVKEVVTKELKTNR